MKDSKLLTTKGAKGFDKDYWEANYNEPEEMDGIANASEHANYLKNFFDLDGIEIKGLIDFGMGQGHLLYEFTKVFNPKNVIGLEPSSYAYEISKKRFSRFKREKFQFFKTDIKNYCEKLINDEQVFDLGVCTSVLQYLSEEELKFCFPVLARNLKYLYLSFPTDKELIRMERDLNFSDSYALRRSRSFYQKIIMPHFTVVSSRVLESKYFFNEKNTHFTELYYRF